MDINFQDRIDRYLLHRDKMTDEEQALFLQEIAADAEKREQYELTCNVKTALTSRAEKLRAMAEFQRNNASESRFTAETAATPAAKSTTNRRKRWMWVSGIAAVAVVGIFLSAPNFLGGDDGAIRGGDDDVFEMTPKHHGCSSPAPTSTEKTNAGTPLNDTIVATTNDTIVIPHE